MKTITIALLIVALAACSQSTSPDDQQVVTPLPTPAPAAESTPSAAKAAPAEPAPAELQPAEGQARLALAIEGMHCTGCAAGVDRRLRAVDGVADCRVDFESGQAVVIYDPSATDATALAAASVAGTNYSVAPLP